MPSVAVRSRTCGDAASFAAQLNVACRRVRRRAEASVFIALPVCTEKQQLARTATSNWQLAPGSAKAVSSVWTGYFHPQATATRWRASGSNGARYQSVDVG